MKIAVILIVLCVVPVIGQSTKSKSTKPTQSVSIKTLTPKDKLQNAIQLSKKQKKISIVGESTIQNKKFVVISEFFAPDRYSSQEFRDGILFKEGIEISGQRYQKKNDQWVKVQKDPFPLRDQFFNFLFPQLYSKKGDAIKIKNVKVTELEEINLDGKTYYRYEYYVSIVDFDWVDTGIAFVNKLTGLLERLETNNRGLFGLVKAVGKYDYEKAVTILAPKDHIVKDWID